MFEFHGWAVIHGDDAEGPVPKAFVAAVNARLQECDDRASQFQVSELGNDMTVLTVNGLRNHPQKQVLALFEWIAEHSPNSYGLLYVNDDEHSDRDNEFVMWRLARGRLKEQSDPFLSPRVPTTVAETIGSA